MGIRLARERKIPVFNLFWTRCDEIHAALETIARTWRSGKDRR